MSISAMGGLGATPVSTEKNQNRQNLLGSSNSFSSLMTDGISSTTTLSGSNLTAKPEDSAVKEFMDFMNKSPAERMQEIWLKQHGITKEQFDAMSPEEKQKLMAQMKQEIQAKIQQEVEKSAAKASLNILV